MITTADISWGGDNPGKASVGEVVDISKIPEVILERWKKDGILVENAE